MRNYLLELIRLQPRLERYERRLERAIDRCSLDISTDTKRLVKRMLRLIDMKAQVVNLAVIYSDLTSSLTPLELALVELIPSGICRSEAAQLLKMDYDEVVKAGNRARLKLNRALRRLEKSGTRLEDYEEMLLARRWGDY